MRSQLGEPASPNRASSPPHEKPINPAGLSLRNIIILYV